ncbi:Rhomboid protease [Lachnellula occidentalis]|uniref:Rhomboid protease n=1 Tax=Lachnellula occidentalis TaxID=215460 RepID=A0A8H8UH02_9HELO|nr:Rhomboid protease [Lachnellula occidentalis]
MPTPVINVLQRGSKLPLSCFSPIVRHNALRISGKGTQFQRTFAGCSVICNALARPHLGGLGSGGYGRATLQRGYKRGSRPAPRRPPPPPPPPQSSSPMPESSSPMPESPALVVGGIIALCASVTAWNEYMKTQPGNKQAKWLVDFRNIWILSRRNLEQGRWYTLITSTFMHNGLAHLLFNMLGLWSFGVPIARAFGTTRFLVLYFGSGIAGGLLQDGYWKRTLPPGSDAAAAGASGCVVGLLGALTMVAPKMGVSFFFVPMTMWQSTLVGALFSGICIQTGALPWIGHVDHLGGMAFGAVYCE